MKKKKGDYKPSEQDMKDAWIIWYSVKFLIQKTLDKQKGIDAMFDTFELGLRELFDKPHAVGSPGEQILERLHTSWEQKSKWSDSVNKDIKKGKADIYTAYSQAVIQTVFCTMPVENEEEFYKEREKDMRELQKSISEWHKSMGDHGKMKN